VTQQLRFLCDFCKTFIVINGISIIITFLGLNFNLHLWLQKKIHVVAVSFSDWKTMHETYNPKMRWEIAKRRESNSSALGKLSELSGSSYPQANHNMDTEVKRMNFKSQTTVASAEMDKVVTR
jgi:hypothetical protein